MIKKFVFILICFSVLCNAQHTISGKLDPVENLNYVVLYQLKGANQNYMGNSSLENGTFELSMPENAEEGMYRLLFDIEKNSYVDFIYSDKDVKMELNPFNPYGSLSFTDSDENKLYTTYLRTTAKYLTKLDSIQINYLKLTSESQKQNAQNTYKLYRDNYYGHQAAIEEKSKGLFANHLIKSNRMFFSSKLHENAQLFFNERKEHFFDFIDFENEVLLNASFLSEKAMNYVFYLNQSDDQQMQKILYEQAVDTLVQKIGNSNQVKKELLTVLLHVFAQLEDTWQVDRIIKSHYSRLPESLKDKYEITKIQERLKLAVGRLAPDFSWVDKGTQRNLYKLDQAETYVLVFWSTDCSHCLNEIPQLYAYTEDNKSVHVISFALERNDEGFKEHTKDLEEWTHILGLQKWEHPTARMYEIVETPTYFVLDSNKRIIAKPEFFRDLKKFYESK